MVLMSLFYMRDQGESIDFIIALINPALLLFID